MKSEIIAVGSEMLTPFRQDTNSLYVTEKLNGIGVTVAFKSIVGDRQKDLVNAIRTALGRVDILILMGGLGPTEDDLTREAVAEALSLTLRRDASQVAASARARRHLAHHHAAEQSEAGRRPGERYAAAEPEWQRSRPVARYHLWRLSQAHRPLARPSARMPPALRHRVPAPSLCGRAAAHHRRANSEGGHDSRVAGRQAAGSHLHHLHRR